MSCNLGATIIGGSGGGSLRGVAAVNERVRSLFSQGSLVKGSVLGDSVQRNAPVSEINTLPHNGYTGNSWFGQICWASGQMYSVCSAQTPGQTLYQISTSQTDTVLNAAVRPDVVFWLPSLNDMGTIGGVSYTTWGNDAAKRQTVKSWIVASVRRFHAAGVAVILMTGWPNNGISGSTPYRNNFSAMYQLIYEVAAEEGCLTVLDMVGQGKFTATDLSFKGGTSLAGDGIHLSGLGQQEFGILAYEQLKQSLGMRPYYPAPGPNFGSNGGLIAEMVPGPISPYTPSGWSINDSALTWGAPLADDDGYGPWNQVVSGTASDQETIIFRNSVSVQRGSKVLVCMEAKGTPVSGTERFEFRMVNATGEYQILSLRCDGKMGSRGWMARQVFELDDSDNSVGLWFYVRGMGNGGGPIYFRARVYNLTSMGLNPYGV